MTKKGFLPGALVLAMLASCAVSGGRERVAPPSPQFQSLLFPPTTQALPAAEFRDLINKTLQTQTYKICTPDSRRTCPVEITITQSGGKCIPDALDTKVPPGVRILWQVQSPEWTFEANGVEFKDAAHAQQAFDGHSNASGQVYFWDVLANPQPGYYKYGIHLRNRQGETCDLDPGIWV